jgi:NitT/TauT family transport system permease protein
MANKKRSNTLESNKKAWHQDAAIVEDKIYWKSKSEFWVWASIATFPLALVINILTESVELSDPIVYQVCLVGITMVLIALYLIYLRYPPKRAKLYHKAQFVFGIGIFLIAWDLLTTKSAVLPYPYFPGFPEVMAVMIDDRDLLIKSAIYSMRLFFLGLITGTILGLATGTLIGWNRQWDYWLSPIIKITGIIPAVVWIPIAMVVLPNSLTTGVFLIFMASWFPVSSMMAAGIIETPNAYFEVAKTLGADEKFLLFRIALPHAMPSMFVGILTATAFSFTTLIVSEMIGAKAGLGFYINWAKGWGAYSKMYAAIIIIAVEFSLILAIISAIRHYVLSWQKGILK